mgnify:CR=1 FL=1
MSDASRQYDLAVIGAGINGAGIARDAAMRGLSVIALDKGDMCNVGILARSTRVYAWMLSRLTATRVKKFFGDKVKGTVTRHELDNLEGLNFLLDESLGGGGTTSLTAASLHTRERPSRRATFRETPPQRTTSARVGTRSRARSIAAARRRERCRMTVS